MRSVSLRALKSKLREYVRLAAGGEAVLITEGDRVVAELAPPSESRTWPLADPRLAPLVRAGLLTPAALPPSPPPKAKPVMTFAELQAHLEEDRDDLAAFEERAGERSLPFEDVAAATKPRGRR